MEDSVAVLSPFQGSGERILIGIADYFRYNECYEIRPYDLSREKIDITEINQNHKACIFVDPTGKWFGRLDEITIPCVTVFQEDEGSLAASILVGDLEIGRLAAEHFHGRGFHHYGFAGRIDQTRMKTIYQSFKESLDLDRYNLHLFSEKFPERMANSEEEDVKKSVFQYRLKTWLESLPKPVGVFVSDDWQCYEVYTCCKMLGLSVPEEVALLGINDDPLACRLATPNLTSIRLPFEKIGYEAGQTLASLIKGDSPQNRLIKPAGVVVRGSTQTIAVEDEVVKKGLDFMERNSQKPIKVEDILDHIGVSRSMLERRFRAELGRTPLVEMRRQRVERARSLLADSEFSIQKISELSGFASNIRFTTVFGEQVGMTPTEFRKAMLPS
ncbi:MAG: substrate-binding domain-containing protein [Opitutales bacterium]|nr:substrate-binding domain-containing protein [Opitutales bacterium]